MKRKILAVVLTLALVFSLLPITASAASPYDDIPNHWAEKAIIKWSDLGILTGADGKFRPDEPITRGELAVIIDRIMKYQTASPNSFTDLGQEFYIEAILKANAAGVMAGDGTSIRPTAPITKEEAAVMLGKALGLKESTAASGFVDSVATSSWALGYVNAMAAKGFIRGYQGAFNPKSSITRAEAVTILDGAIQGLYSKPAEYTGNVNGIAIVNTSGVMLKDMTINGDLIITEGVGSGEVTLENVTVTGNTIVRGGGPNSIHIQGNSWLTNLIIEKTDDGQLRVVTENGAVVDAVYIEDGNDDIILTGSFKSVTISADVTVKAVGADIDAMTINADQASLDLDKTSSVGTLTLDSAIKVNNNGEITKAFINVDGVTIDGNMPTEVITAPGVKDTDSSGGVPGGGIGSPGGGGIPGGNGGIPGGGTGGGQTDAEKVAAAKAAIEHGTYKNLHITDINSQTEKTEAVQAVVQTLNGETTLIVTWNIETSKYDVEIRLGDASETVSVTATFVDTDQTSPLIPAPIWITNGKHLVLYTGGLDTAKLSSGLYYFSGEFLNTNGISINTANGRLYSTDLDISFMIQGLTADSQYIKFRVYERNDISIQDTNQMTPVTDYSKKLNVVVTLPSTPCSAVGYDTGTNIITVTRSPPFDTKHKYLLSYTDGITNYGTVFQQISGNQMTFLDVLHNTVPNNYTFIEFLSVTIDDEGEATLVITRQPDFI